MGQRGEEDECRNYYASLVNHPEVKAASAQRPFESMRSPRFAESGYAGLLIRLANELQSSRMNRFAFDARQPKVP